MARRSGQVGYEEVKGGWYPRSVSDGCCRAREEGLSQQADLPDLRTWISNETRTAEKAKGNHCRERG